jgi:altronate dehydratase small subunit
MQTARSGSGAGDHTQPFPSKEKHTMNAALHINAKDNVATCLRPVSKGETLSFGPVSVTATMDIPVFHKIAIAEIAVNGLCYKYGEIIGDATQAIAAGDHVHVHNIESTRGRGDKQSK